MAQINFICPHQNHFSSQILFICLSDQCFNKRKCCVYCIDEEHSKHEIVSIQKFLKDINFTLQKNNNHPEKQQIYNLINSTRKSYMTAFQGIRSSFEQCLSRCQTKIHALLNNIHELLTVNNENTITNHILNSFIETNSVINDYLDLYKKARTVEIGTLQEMKKAFRGSSFLFETKIYEAEDLIHNQLAKLDNILKKFKLKGKTYETDFVFSDLNKSSSIQLSDSKKSILRSSAASGQGICCMDKSIDPINNKFFVRINSNATKKLCIGVCILDIVKKQNFTSCSGLGKGTYAIEQSTIGYSYMNPNSYATFSNHHVLNYNSVGNNNVMNAGWNFMEGDVMMVSVNYVQNNIIFYVLNKNFDPTNDEDEDQSIFENCFLMPIKLDEGELHPFVGLNGNGTDSVTILTREEIAEIIKSFGDQWTQQFQNSENQEDFNIF